MDLDYADDAVLLKESPGLWTISLQKFEDKAGTMRLHASWVKQKIHNVGSENAPAPIMIAGQKIGVTDKLTYRH